MRWTVRRDDESGLESSFLFGGACGKLGMSKIRIYFGFKNGKLVSVLHSVNGDVKKVVDCTYYVAEPREVEKQIERWKRENS
jgi:hypothetical protein